MVMSVYMTISLTVERYLSVVRPLLALRHRSTSSYLFLAAPGMLFSLLFTLPNYFILTTELDQTNHQEMELLQLIGNDSLMDSSWLPEVHQPCRIRLVWAHWRFNHAFKTVSSILIGKMFRYKIVLTAGVCPLVALAFCDYHPLHCAFLAE